MGNHSSVLAIVLATLSWLVASSALAFHCSVDWSDDVTLKRTEHIVWVEVSRVEYAEALTKALLSAEDVDAGYVKLLKVSLKTIKRLKGPDLGVEHIYDLAGVGTGFVGFVPGYFYAIALDGTTSDEEVPEEWPDNSVVINSCDVISVAASLNDDQFQKDLARIRASVPILE